MTDTSSEDVEKGKGWVDVPGKGRPIFEDLIRDTGHDAGNGDKEVDHKRSFASPGEEGREEQGHRGLDVGPDSQEHDKDAWVSAPEQLRSDPHAGGCKEETEDELHGHKFEVVGQIVGPRLETILLFAKSRSNNNKKSYQKHERADAL